MPSLNYDLIEETDMAQFGIRLECEWFTADSNIRGALQQINANSFEYEAGLCKYELADWQLYVWGDPARRNQDALIIEYLIQQKAMSVFGRSWVALSKNGPIIQGATDQLGLFPILVHELKDNWCICSDRNMLLALSGEVPKLNATAMQHLLCFGQILDSSSIIEGASHLAAARYFVLENAELKLHQLPRQQPLCDSQPTNFEQAVEAFVESVRESLQNAVNPILSLSGGLDSRLILAACQALNKKLPALCYGNGYSDDVRIAKQLATLAKIPLFIGKSPTQEDNWQTTKRISLIGLGEVPTHHAHALMDPALLEQTRDRTVLTGTGAEAFRAFYYDRGMPGFELFDQRWLRKLCLPRIQRYIREEFFRLAQPVFRILPQLEQRLLPLFEQTLQFNLKQDIDCARAADQFYLDIRVCRMVVAGQQLLDPFYQRSHPFLSPQVLATVGNLPATFKIGSTFHRQAIIRLSPKLADISWDKTGRPLRQGLPISERYPGLMRYVGHKGIYGKRAAPMFDHAKNGHLPYAHVLDRILTQIGCSDEKQRQQQIWQLLQSTALPHIKGLTEVWSHLLSARQQQQGAS